LVTCGLFISGGVGGGSTAVGAVNYIEKCKESPRVYFEWEMINKKER